MDLPREKICSDARMLTPDQIEDWRKAKVPSSQLIFDRNGFSTTIAALTMVKGFVPTNPRARGRMPTCQLATDQTILHAPKSYHASYVDKDPQEEYHDDRMPSVVLLWWWPPLYIYVAVGSRNAVAETACKPATAQNACNANTRSRKPA